MHKDTLYNALQEPFDGLPKMRDELLELTDVYPWFQTAHVLLCKADQVAGHHAYEQHLKRAAVYSMDRERLYRLIMQEKLDAAIERIEEEIQTMDEVIEVPDVEHGPAPEDNQKSAGQLPETPSGTAEIPPAEADITEDGSEMTVPKHVKSADLDDLQRQILVDAISSSIEKEVGEIEQEGAEEDLEGVALPGEEHADEELEYHAAPENGIEAPEIPPVVVDGEELSPFTRWVMERARSLNYTTDLETTEGNSSDPVEAPRPTAKPEDLIDRFIKAEPKITPKKVDQYEIPTAIDAGLIEDDEFMTETLAQIYAKQGNLGKARKAYKLLSLKYPEKSIYFANQIKKLDQLKRK
jgi:hypothetical protein